MLNAPSYCQIIFNSPFYYIKCTPPYNEIGKIYKDVKLSISDGINPPKEYAPFINIANSNKKPYFECDSKPDSFFQ